MSNVSTSLIFRKDLEEKKEKLNKEDKIYIYKRKYRQYPGFNVRRALLLSILDSYSISVGFAWPSNQHLCDELGIDEKTLKRDLDFMVEGGYIWLYYYPTKDGIEREIVTLLSAAKYYKLQLKLNWPGKPQKFHDEFLLNTFDPDLSMNIDLPEKMSAGLPEKMSAAENTAYSNREIKSDVNIREETPPLFKKDLREELTKTFSDPKDIEDGIRWLELQPEKKRTSMKCEIASTIAAVKGRYARDFLVKYDEKDHSLPENSQESFEKLEEKKQEIRKENMNKNGHMIGYVTKYLQKYEWFEEKEANEGIFLLNKILEFEKDEDGVSYCTFPNGEQVFGRIPGVYANLVKSNLQELRKLIIHFFDLNNLKSYEDKRILEKLGEDASV